MPCYIRRLTPQGLEVVGYSAESLADATQYEPIDGIYTVTNTYNTFQVLKFDAHLNRLEDSASRADIPLQLDRHRLKQSLRQMIEDAGFGSVRFRISVARNEPDNLILLLEPFSPPSAELREQGVRCISVPHSARHHPEAKTTDWMHQRTALKDAMPEGIYDTFLLDDEGHILEGLGSNFYAIVDDELRTAGEGVLLGISQQIIFEIAPSILPIRRDAVHVDDLSNFQESFLTSSSRGIIPVIEIDGIPIGNGQRGEWTRQLQDAYQSWVDDNLETLA